MTEIYIHVSGNLTPKDLKNFFSGDGDSIHFDLKVNNDESVREKVS